MKTNLILIRGLPGSGKTTLATDLCEFHEKTSDFAKHFEADMFFMEETGQNGMQYNFVADQLYNAHNWCQSVTREHLRYYSELPPVPQQEAYVYVSNTFTTLKEMKPYFDMAKEFDILPQVILCQGFFGSVHDVPLETMKKMKERFVYNLDSLYEGLE